MSASAFSTTFMVAADACRLLQGKTEIGGIYGDQGHRHHCNWCKSWVYTEAVGQPDSIYVRATLIDDPYWFAPRLETQAAEKPNWAVTGAQRSFARFPDDFQKLLADYGEARSGWDSSGAD